MAAARRPWWRACWPWLLGYAALTLPTAKGMGPTPGPADAAFADTLALPPEQRLALAQKLTGVPSLRGYLQLWLLAFDPEPQVALAAARAALDNCQPASEAACVTSLAAFLRPEATPASDLAREALRRRAPLASLEAASVAHRLDLVAEATAALGLPGPRARQTQQLLLRLAEDGDPEVQQAAAAALMTLDR